MGYTPQTWVDGPAGGTPVSAARLNHMETGIDEALGSEYADALGVTGSGSGPFGSKTSLFASGGSDVFWQRAWAGGGSQLVEGHFIEAGQLANSFQTNYTPGVNIEATYNNYSYSDDFTKFYQLTNYTNISPDGAAGIAQLSLSSTEGLKLYAYTSNLATSLTMTGVTGQTLPLLDLKDSTSTTDLRVVAGANEVDLFMGYGAHTDLVDLYAYATGSTLLLQADTGNASVVLGAQSSGWGGQLYITARAGQTDPLLDLKDSGGNNSLFQVVPAHSGYSVGFQMQGPTHATDFSDWHRDFQGDGTARTGRDRLICVPDTANPVSFDVDLGIAPDGTTGYTLLRILDSPSMFEWASDRDSAVAGLTLRGHAGQTTPLLDLKDSFGIDCLSMTPGVAGASNSSFLVQDIASHGNYMNFAADNDAAFLVVFHNTAAFAATYDTGASHIGFYGASPVAKQTGVAVSSAGIHAALVNIGLIAA